MKCDDGQTVLMTGSWHGYFLYQRYIFLQLNHASFATDKAWQNLCHARPYDLVAATEVQSKGSGFCNNTNVTSECIRCPREEY